MAEELAFFFFLYDSDPLEKEMATHSSILIGEIPWSEDPGGLQSMGLQESQTRLSAKQARMHGTMRAV